MTDPERRRRVEELCDAALDRNASERAAFVAAACAGDASLQHDVNELLGQAHRAETFLEMPLGALAAYALAEDQPPLVGRRIGAYAVGSLLGAGGMGEVYRALDTRLRRDVALKILPPALAATPERRDRFEREARAISALNHPHICTLFDVGHQDGVDFLVLEYLDGETVAARLARTGRLAPNAALTIAIGICSALDAAHRAGIVHRDLTPANVMLTKGGPKLLDFGLAETARAAESGTTGTTATPPRVTERGAIAGTLHYLTPEQLAGREADARTDIHAFGVLLFEMLTGRPAFEGDTRARLVSAILNDPPPPLSHLPPSLDRILTTCLAKDPDDRYQSARDLVRDLQWAASEFETAARAGASVRRPSTRLAWGAAALATLASIALVIAGLRHGGEVPPGTEPVRFAIAPPANSSFGGPGVGGTGTATQVALSPDGRHIVFVAATESTYRIWLRPVGALAATPIAGTEGGTYPFWSPDSRFIAFFAGGKLKRIQIGGGPVTVLADTPAGRGGSWSRDDVIVFAPAGAGAGLMRVPSAGGISTPVTTLDPTTGEDSHRWPHFLPDGRHFFYTAISGACCPPPRPSLIRIGSLDSRDADLTLLPADSSALYASGHMLFARNRTLMAQAFNLESRQLTGQPFPIAEHVSMEGSRYVGASASTTGTLVYGTEESATPSSLTWFDRSGRVRGTVGETGRYVDLALSPDERRIAVAMETGTPPNVDIWVIDPVRNVRSRHTFDDGVDASPVWSADGRRITFEGHRSERVSLRQIAIEGPASDELLLEPTANVTNLAPSSWARDGRIITYTLVGARPLRFDVWALPTFGERKPFPLLQTEYVEMSGVLSPDGHWIAYMSTETGRPNIHVQSLGGTARKYQVSADGGSYPVWRADGKELFYLGGDKMLTAVPIDTASGFEAGRPQALFAVNAQTTPVGHQVYAVTNDGQRFLVNARSADDEVVSLTVIVNWPRSALR